MIIRYSHEIEFEFYATTTKTDFSLRLLYTYCTCTVIPPYFALSLHNTLPRVCTRRTPTTLETQFGTQFGTRFGTQVGTQLTRCLLSFCSFCASSSSFSSFWGCLLEFWLLEFWQARHGAQGRALVQA